MLSIILLQKNEQIHRASSRLFRNCYSWINLTHSHSELWLSTAEARQCVSWFFQSDLINSTHEIARTQQEWIYVHLSILETEVQDEGTVGLLPAQPNFCSKDLKLLVVALKRASLGSLHKGTNPVHWRQCNSQQTPTFYLLSQFQHMNSGGRHKYSDHSSVLP